MRRQIRQIGTLPPLQRDTAKIVPNSVILGGKTEATNVVGTALDGAITITRIADNVPVYDTSLRITVTEAGKFKIKNVDTGYETEVKDASASDVTVTDFHGLSILVESGLNGAVADDICDVNVWGDSSYIVPGTILGRIKNEASDFYGMFEPIKSDLTQYDILRVCGGMIETNKANFVAPISDTMNTDDRYTVDVYVFGQVFESVCRDINMTDNAKARLDGIVWE